MTMSGQDSPPSSKTAEKFVVRLPRGMRRRIADAARCYRRSMNSEIVARLEQSLDAAEPFVPAGVNEPTPEPPPDPTPAGADGDEEARLLRAFRTLSAERRRALLALLD
jgi:DNA-directed RNA polymerase specialized sigma24 family protein